MKKVLFTAAIIGSLFFTSCNSDDDATKEQEVIKVPATYVFKRDGVSSVSFGGQTTRIKMAQEFTSALGKNDLNQIQLRAMFAHEEGAQDFTDADLNASNKSIRSKTAASHDYFSTNSTDATAIKTKFDEWITLQTSVVFQNWAETATPGQAGQLPRGSKTAYVSDKGLEMNQVVAKSLIGALMTDQILNNYLSPAVLDASDNKAKNDAGTVVEGKGYTTMEHKWDEAYGYIYGTSQDATKPNATIGSDDSFLNKYTGKVDGDSDFAGTAAAIWDAFKLGRAAIVAKEYKVRDEQAEIIRENISKVIAIRAVHYLQAGKGLLNPNDMGPAFHDLSEGYGFVYSLQFTRKPGTTAPYFTKAEVTALLADLMGDGENGLWDVTAGTLDTISDTIAAKFGFTKDKA
ncbi:MAG: DUF4856 domain-containing protein [Cellulophaga sp.]